MTTKQKVLALQFVAFLMIIAILIIRAGSNPYAGLTAPTLTSGAALPADYSPSEAPATVGPPEVIGFIVACLGIALIGWVFEHRKDRGQTDKKVQRRTRRTA